MKKFCHRILLKMSCKPLYRCKFLLSLSFLILFSLGFASQSRLNAAGSSELQQQQQTISGQVTDVETGEPLPGVNIMVKGTAQGTVTNQSGEYEIQVSEEDAILVFSYVGYKERELPVGSSPMNVELVPDVKAMDEVVVVGYGTQKKSDITGSVASLSSERLDQVPNVDVSQALQGAVPGLLINQTSAGTTPSTSIMVRGRNSIKAGNDPLIVVDGVPYDGNLRDISPNDIESVEVLKDASAAAIYGSRGSNGVVLITTKQGEE